MERLHPPAAVLEIADKLEDAGFEAWCVGGAIRDAILGHSHLDWDLATSATPSEIRTLFGERRTIPIGIEFGTVGVLDRAGGMHEVTTFRRDVKADGRHAEVEFGVSLEDDLARRDFTINAIAYSPRLREVRDPFGGRDDIARRLVRAVGDPDARMREDRLRALRAIRFAARFEFAIDATTLAAIRASAPFLGRLSPERVKQELDKTMEQVRLPSRALAVWRDTGAFETLIPPVGTISAERMAAPDFIGVPNRAKPARRAIRFAALLSELPANEVATILSSLRSSRQELQAVSTMVDRWHALGDEIARALAADAPPSDAQVRRWVAAIGRLTVGAFMRAANGVWRARAQKGLEAPTAIAVRALYRRMLRSAFHDAIDLGSLAIDGDDLRRAGIPAGPGLGKILNALLATVIEDPSRNTTDWLLHEGKRLHADA